MSVSSVLTLLEIPSTDNPMHRSFLTRVDSSSLKSESDGIALYFMFSMSPLVYAMHLSFKNTIADLLYFVYSVVVAII